MCKASEGRSYKWTNGKTLGEGVFSNDKQKFENEILAVLNHDGVFLPEIFT